MEPGWEVLIRNPGVCQADTNEGHPCQNTVMKDEDYCSSHLQAGWPKRSEIGSFQEEGFATARDIRDEKARRKAEQSRKKK